MATRYRGAAGCGKGIGRHNRILRPSLERNPAMRTTTTSIEISAGADTVWSILMDFSAYPEWNPFIVQIEGVPEIGERLGARLRPPGGRAMTFKPRVTEREDGRFFQWLGSVGFRGIFDGRHSFRVTPTEHGVRFEQSEQFTGILSPLLFRIYGERTEEGFRAMNEALRERAEAASGGSR
jgi:hypothetical protein